MEKNTTSVTTHFKKLQQEITCLLSNTLRLFVPEWWTKSYQSYLISILSLFAFCSFYIKCSMWPPCCWTTHYYTV